MFPDIKYVTPEFWFQNNPDFYNGWVQLRSKRDFATSVSAWRRNRTLISNGIHFRVVGDAMGRASGIKRFTLWMARICFSQTKSGLTNGERQTPSFHPQEGCNRHLLCENGHVEEGVVFRGRRGELAQKNWRVWRNCSALYWLPPGVYATEKLTTQPKNIFLIQMDTWEPGKSTRKFLARARERGTKDADLTRDPRGNLGNGYEHLWCEYDDILMLCMQRQLAPVSRILLCPVELWTDDKGINKPDDEVYRAFQMYLEYNDTFLLRIFQPLSGFVVNFRA